MLLLNHTLQSATLQTVHWTESNLSVLQWQARQGKPKDFLASIASAVIHRINFPKVKAGKMGRKASLNAKVRPLLSYHDQQEATQTVALVLCTPHVVKWTDSKGIRHERKIGSALDDCKMIFAHWKIVFREVRAILNIDRNSKRGQADTANPIDLMTEAEADFLTAQTRKPYHLARRKAIARKMRYQRALVWTAYALDSKRQRHSTFRKQLDVCRFVCALYSKTAKGFSEIIGDASTDEALYMTMHRYKEYTRKAEDFLTAEALQGVKARKIEFKSFADLHAVCD
jgi:hypothetical protein